jgi:multisubunit Na+/H+ antiporter MnhG subunit
MTVMSERTGRNLHREVVFDFVKYIMLIAASFIVATRIYFVSFLGALLFVDMFTRRFAMPVKTSYALIILIGALIFVTLT